MDLYPAMWGVLLFHTKVSIKWKFNGSLGFKIGLPGTIPGHDPNIVKKNNEQFN